MNIQKIKKELREKQRVTNNPTVMIKREGLEFIYFTQMANGRKNIYKVSIVKNGQFITKEI